MASTYTIASDLSYEVFQLRRCQGEIATPQLDESNRHLYTVEAIPVIRRLRDLDDAEPELETFAGLKLRHGR